MTIERHNIVKLASTPSMFYKVITAGSEQSTIGPFTLSLSNHRLMVPTAELEQIAVSTNSWNAEHFNVNDWTFDTIAGAVRNGVPMSLKHDGERKDFTALDGRRFTLSDGTEVSSAVADGYALGSAADWVVFEALAAEQREFLAAGTVVTLNHGVHPTYTHAVLQSSGTDYPEQYVYGVHPETLEREPGRDFYLQQSAYVGTGKTLEEWRDSLAPTVANGNIVSTREGETVVIVDSESATHYKVAALNSDMTLGAESTLRRYAVAEVLAESVTADFATEYSARLRLAESLSALSINTVNRALQHASSNGYCSETLIALTGAGHKAPKVRVTGTITIPLDIVMDSKQEWEKVRDIFGRVFNNGESWEKAALSKVNLMQYIDVSKIAESEGFKVEPVYGSPTVRPLS